MYDFYVTEQALALKVILKTSMMHQHSPIIYGHVNMALCSYC